ncbi:MAG TPA: hypothetical protein VMT58_04585, partial [Candidatus Binataceae bacterium]|nr:hypothetical protein [Candidatus Binataceae bacterium]
MKRPTYYSLRLGVSARLYGGISRATSVVVFALVLAIVPHTFAVAQTVTPTSTPTPVPAIFAANFQGFSLTVYPNGGGGNIFPLSEIFDTTNTLHYATGLAVSPGGKIFATNCENGNGSYNDAVTIFRPGASYYDPPIDIINGWNTGLYCPTGIALDSSGDIFVADPPFNSIYIYGSGAIGNVQPIATISGSNTGLGFPWSIAFDASGKIYVSNVLNNSVTVYP